MKKALLILMFVFQSQIHIVNANETTEAVEPLSIEKMLNEAKLEKLQAEIMVDTMVKSGRFSADQGERARRGIASVHDEDLTAIKEEALANIKAPNLANK